MNGKQLERILELGEGGRLGLLANQTSYDVHLGKYGFQMLAGFASYLRVFLPEHGLFAELQDQIGLEDTAAYAHYIDQTGQNCEFLSLYGFQEQTLRPDRQGLSDLDWLIVDLQDVGSRYYTFLTTLYYCLEVIKDLRAAGASIRCAVMDAVNPIGRTVEGTPLPAEFESFVGLPGILHRHGLTTGEMAQYFCRRLSLEPEALHIIQDHSNQDPGMKNPEEMVRQSGDSPELVAARPGSAILVGSPGSAPASMGAGPGSIGLLESVFPVYPSPNMPSVETAMVYPGQCLLEGTNLSEGRGTTRPFEIFGAPFLSSLIKSAASFYLPDATLRPLRFLPTFHKHGNEICEGFQLHRRGSDFAPLFCSMRILRWIRANVKEFQWKKGVYEFRSDRPAIELLAGDPILLAYLRDTPAPREDRLDEQDLAVLEHMAREEGRWMEDTGFLWKDSTLHSSSGALLARHA